MTKFAIQKEYVNSKEEQAILMGKALHPDEYSQDNTGIE
jgi:hypothetical protein